MKIEPPTWSKPSTTTLSTQPEIPIQLSNTPTASPALIPRTILNVKLRPPPRPVCIEPP